MNRRCRFVCLALVVAATSLLAQESDRAPADRHAQTHESDSYVLVLKKQAIARGPDFAQRAIALQTGKKRHLQNFVWLSTNEGSFLVADAASVQSILDFEQTQRTLNKRWQRDATNPALAGQLRQEQKQHAANRDEFIWTLFDNLKQQGRLVRVK